ncbi:LuxR C-terminal-related transcriptional regulator [Actinocatenispora thailandica]|uniref:LuxR C-terminal-related transcriptional regulator n=1 Tax=Actinocatenispora thailandica TaxID=227318 RepID=UPI0019528F94|nr:LuxR family transcriptional regulator [Actinocatenispora thailandica]
MRKPAATPRPLVGRDRQLDELAIALHAAGHGVSAVIEILGDPGSGKTALLDQLAYRSAGTGASVVTASGDRFAPARPHGLTREILTRSGAETRDPGGVHRAVADWLTRLPAPRLLLFDDAHWSDPDSVDLLGRLLSEPPDGVLTVVAYRPRQCSPRMRDRLSRATRQRRLTLPPLSPADVTRLSGLAEDTALYTLCAGNPRLALVTASGLAGAAAPAWLTAAAQSAIEQTGSELSAVADRHQRCLAAASVLACGQRTRGHWPTAPLAVEEVAALAAGPDAARSIDALVAHDLLRSDGTNGLRFRDTLVAMIAYRRLGPGERWRLHAAAATLLRSRGYPAADYAEHVRLSAARSDNAAVEALRAAGRQSHARNPLRAAELLRSALDLLPPDADQVAETRVELAEAMASGGALHEASDLLDRHPPAGPAELRDRAATTRARCQRLLGHPDEALTVVRSRLTAEPGAAGRLPLLTEAALDAVLCNASGTDELVAEARRAAAERGDDPGLRTVSAIQALAAAAAGHRTAALAALEPVATALDAMPNPAPDLAMIVAGSELLLEHDRRARHHFDQALRTAGTARRGDLLPRLLVGRGAAALRLGSVGHAVADLRDALRAVEGSPPGHLGTLATALLAAALAERDGSSAGNAGADPPPPTAATWYGSLPQRALARLRGSEAALLACCGGASLGLVPRATRPYWSSVLFELAIRRHDDAAARRWVAQALWQARGLGLPGMSAHARLARARWLQHRGRPEAALPAAGTAISTYQSLGWRIAEADAHLFAAIAAGRCRRWRDAQDHLGAARRLAEATGSERLRRSAIEQQRRIGGLAGRSSAHPGSPLTRREREIARLVLTGASNARIAERLCVTVKTVEAHLTHVYRKLGAGSRTQLVTLLLGHPDALEQC